MQYLFLSTDAVFEALPNHYHVQEFEATSDSAAIHLAQEFVARNSEGVVGHLLRRASERAERVATCFLIVQKFRGDRDGQTHWGRTSSGVFASKELACEAAENMENVHRNLVYAPGGNLVGNIPAKEAKTA